MPYWFLQTRRELVACQSLLLELHALVSPSHNAIFKGSCTKIMILLGVLRHQSNESKLESLPIYEIRLEKVCQRGEVELR